MTNKNMQDWRIEFADLETEDLLLLINMISGSLLARLTRDYAEKLTATPNQLKPSLQNQPKKEADAG